MALARSAHAAFPGQNGKIAWEREVLVQPSSATLRGSFQRNGDQLWTMNPDGSAQVNIGSDPPFDFERPAWSADGRTIAIRKQDVGDPPIISQIWVLAADGSGAHNISNSSTFDKDPAWSPDGTKLVFTRRDETSGLFSLWTMGPDGSNVHQFLAPADGTEDQDPAWSPDGSTIAYAHFDRPGGPGQIWLVGADGSNPHNISNNSDDDDHPNWAPDGRSIAFDKSVDDDFQDNGAGIWVMGADGSAQHAITTPLPGFGPGSFSDLRPAFSPDGTLITFQRENDDEDSPTFPQTAIMVMGADGSNVHNISNPDSSTTDIKPDWQPIPIVATAPPPPAGCTHACGPKVSVAGVRRACLARKTLNLRVHVGGANKLRSVTVSLDGKRLRKTTHRRFTLKLKLTGLKPGRHRLRIVAVDSAGKKVTLKRTVARCAAAKPRHRAAPRFTG
jgi:Tol biopolymer transport system component